MFFLVCQILFQVLYNLLNRVYKTFIINWEFEHHLLLFELIGGWTD